MSFSLTTLITVWITTTKYAYNKIEQELRIGQNVAENVLKLQEQQLLSSSEVLASDFGFRQAVATGDNKTLTSVLKNHGQRINADLMLLFSLNGDLLSSSTKKPTTTPLPRLKTLLPKLISNNGVTIMALIDEKLYQSILVPINAPTPRAIALVGFEINHTFIKNLAQISKYDVSISINTPKQQKFFITTLPQKEKANLKENKSNTLTIWTAVISKNNLFHSKAISLYDRDDLNVLLHFHHNISNFMRDFYLLIVKISIITIVSFIFSIILTAIISKRIATPLSKIANIAEHIANENYGHKTNIRTKIKEIASLLHSFENMKNKINLREKTIQSQHQYYKRLLETMDSIIIGIDSGDKVIYWNSHAEQFFSISMQDAYKKQILKLGVLWDWSIISRKILTATTEKIHSKQFELPVNLPNNQKHLLSAKVAPFVSEGDEDNGYLIIANDITQHKHEEQQRQQAAKLQSIGQLASGVAHEINTPIQYVGDNIRFLEEAYHDLSQYILAVESIAKNPAASSVSEAKLASLRTEKDIDYLSGEVPMAITQSLDGIDRITSIVKAMKDFSHPGSEDKVPADINKAISGTIALAKNVWKYVATLETHFDESLNRIPCILDKFNEVILNLIVNAADAIGDCDKHKSASDGLISISTGQTSEYAEIRIRDNASGIPKSIQGKIFDPFFTTKSVGKGTGQGLSICYDIIVEKHEGKLLYETEKNIGTTFIIQLPLDEETTNDK